MYTDVVLSNLHIFISLGLHLTQSHSLEIQREDESVTLLHLRNQAYCRAEARELLVTLGTGYTGGITEEKASLVWEESQRKKSPLHERTLAISWTYKQKNLDRWGDQRLSGTNSAEWDQDKRKNKTKILFLSGTLCSVMILLVGKI